MHACKHKFSLWSMLTAALPIELIKHMEPPASEPSTHITMLISMMLAIVSFDAMSMLVEIVVCIVLFQIAWVQVSPPAVLFYMAYFQGI